MKKLFTLIAIALLMAACSADITNNNVVGDKRHISFSVMEDDAVSVKVEDSSTRSTAMSAFDHDITPWAANQMEQQLTCVSQKVVEAETDFPADEQLCLTITDEPRISRTGITRGALQNMVDTRSLVFGVTEFLENQTTSPVFSNKAPKVQNTTLDGGHELFLADETWEDNAYNGTKYDFYAYAPQVTVAGDKGITLSNDNRTITYNPSGVAVVDQPDLMTALKATSAYVDVVPLIFQHRLCAIQIKTSGTWAAGFHVSAVKFTNVISSGTFNIDTDKDDDWTNYGSVGDYVVSGFNEADATGISVTGPDDKWLMMVPQTLSGAKICITLTDNQTNTHSYNVTAPISAYTWTAGHTVTYTISPASISTMTVNYPASWNNGGNPVAGPVTTYETDDQFGLFVLDKDNNILVSNEPVNPTTGDAAASRTLNIPTTIFKSKQYKYFLMYPYRNDLATIVNATVATNYDNYYKVGATATGRTADANAFFADVVSNWTPANDQSAAADFKKQDLQIASLSGENFYMAHKMGLVNISLGTKTVPTTRTYSSGGASGPDPITGMKYTDSDGTQTVTASSEFDDSSKPLNSSGYLYIVNGSKTLKSVSTVNTDWERELTGIVAGSYNAITIQNTDIKRTCYKFTALFPYTGVVQEFPLPVKGTMTMECWGASGGGFTEQSANYKAGYGGYVCGSISNVPHYKVLYVYVGQGGGQRNHNYPFNGGGGCYKSENAVHYAGQGGGATDIRLKKHSYGTWGGLISVSNATSSAITSHAGDDSFDSRLIVAGGGGGANVYSGSGHTGSSLGGDAGGLIGYSGAVSGGSGIEDGTAPTGGTQSGGGRGGLWNGSLLDSWDGCFGYGNFGEFGGGGGGYWGGGSGADGAGVVSSGAGGSSFISGHAGCTSLSYGGTTYTFSSTTMIDGKGKGWTTANQTTGGSAVTMPTPPRGTISGGNVGNGYAKITMTTPDND